MKVPMQWLRQYTDVTVSPDVFEREMIMHGTSVEGIEDQKDSLSGVVVGRILSVRPHENSDHMVVCSVDVGQDAPVQIVTGAPNVHEGDEVPVALVGARLPGGTIIRQSTLRGVESYGMCCSGPELGVPEYLYPSVGDKGLLIFHEDYAPGTDVRSILGVDDVIVDFEILANRPDCLSVWGVAREAAVVFGKPFRKPEITVKTVPGKVEDYVDIQVEDAVLCPRYCARVVKNVKVGPSPMWLRKALHGAGIRSINNVVDITNYVMLETGHPMHAFDLDRVKQRTILVRRAHEGESITTLDGKERALTPDMLMICDRTDATGIAGIMGGEESEITEQTRQVLFEIASFDRTSIRLTSRGLGMRTESSGRFERGVCAATCREAADRACQLICQLGAGDVIEGVYDFYPEPAAPRSIRASVTRINERIGLQIPGEEMCSILTRLEMQTVLDGDTLTVIPPLFREDMEQEADVSEEVLRIYGYEHLTETLPLGAVQPASINESMKLSRETGRFLSGCGMYEIRNFSFISPRLLSALLLDAQDPRMNPLKILNPLGEETSVMRPSLVPSVLGSLALNQSRNNPEALLYEIAPVFDTTCPSESGQPRECPFACFGGYGEHADFFFFRDVAVDLLSQFGIQVTLRRAQEPYLHPGRSAELLAGGRRVATVGEVHPEVLKNFELSQRVILAEVDLDAVQALKQPMGQIAPLPRYPAVTRDLALVVEESVMVGEMMDLVRDAAGDLLESVRIFDIYRGTQLRPGKKSVAFSMVFRSAERTLTDDDVNPVIDQILSRSKAQFAAVLR